MLSLYNFYVSQSFITCMMDLLTHLHRCVSRVVQMTRQGFLDAATRAFFAEFNIWNSNVGLCAKTK